MKKITICALALLIILSACAAPEKPAQEAPETPAISAEPEIIEAPEPDAEIEPEPEPEIIPEPEPTREEMDFEAPVLEISLTASEDRKLPRISDGDYETKIKLSAGSTLTLRSEEEITALYIVWDNVPGEWSANGEAFGENGFIHEFCELSERANTVELAFSNDVTICDIYALGWGKLPEFVQVWLPPCEEADLLLFPTHGDDEHLFFGGTMPYYAGEMGKKVQVCYMTNHWNEQPRPHEQLNGLYTVGIRNYPVMSAFNDVYVGDLDKAQSRYGSDFMSYQIEMIRRFKPLVVIGHDINGEYGHGAHMLAGRTLLKSVERAADPEYDAASAEKYGVWDTEKLYLHLYSENKIVMDWDKPLEAFGGKTAFEVAKEGYSRHLSQQKWAFHVAVIDERTSSYKFGLARSIVGEDILKNDFLENTER